MRALYSLNDAETSVDTNKKLLYNCKTKTNNIHMYLAEITVVKPSNKALYKECDSICLLSKNLYNATLYIQRQNYKAGNPYIKPFRLVNQLIKENNPHYYALGTAAGGYVVKQLDESYKSFFSLCKLKQSGMYDGSVNLPKYKDKITGRNVVTFYKQRLRKMTYKREGLIHLSKTNIKFKSKIAFDDIQEVKIVPKGEFYEIQVIYTKNEELPITTCNFAAIDMGVNNLATVVTTHSSPFIINGRPVKSINHFWNKRISKMKSKLKKGVRSSKSIRLITNKRNRRVNDYLHKASRELVNQLKSLAVSKVVIGANTGQKKNIRLGKVNNQKFVHIPHERFTKMIMYKCKLAGIACSVAEESYTSKCSFLDDENVEKHDTYKGRRIKRGLFRSSTGKTINADVNGAYNIMKKHLGIAFAMLDPVKVSNTPKILNIG